MAEITEADLLNYDRLRADIGACDDALDDTEAEEIFAEAGETYTGTATIKAQTRIIAIGRILASSAKLVDYAQDTTQEKMSQVFAHLKDLLKIWQDNLANAIADEKTAARGSSAARFGGRRTKPARVQEWPG